MNQLIIYIEVHKEHQFTFGNLILKQLKESYHDATILDLDNFSSKDLFECAYQAVKDSSSTSLIIKQEDKTATLGPLLPFINKLLREKELQIKAALISESEILKKMLSRMDSFNNYSEQQFLLAIKKPR